MRNNLVSCTVLRSARLARAWPNRSLVLLFTRRQLAVLCIRVHGQLWQVRSCICLIDVPAFISAKDNIAFLRRLYEVTLGSSHLRRRSIAQSTCATLPNLQERRVLPYRASLLAQVWVDRELNTACASE